MTAEKIIEKIKKDSEKEINHILNDAKRHASYIINNAKNEGNSAAKKILSEGKKQEENLLRILLSKANQEVKRDIMNAREHIMEECFTKAHHELSILKGKKYEEVVENLIKNGCAKIEGKCNILSSRNVDKEIAKKLGLDVVGRVETAGGVVIKSINNKITLDYTFDGILKHKKDEIRRKVGKLLFS